MHREYHRWFSPSLRRDMELLIFGHGGARVLVFPTSRGKFYEFEDRGMIAELADPIHRGYIQVYCIDSVDAESWYAYHVHPYWRGVRHNQYHAYISNEVLPLSRHKNGNPFLITLGASFGGFHAVSFGLKYPNLVGRILCMSGLCDIRSFLDGYYDDNVYYNNPVDFIANEHDPHRLDLLRRQDIILAIGKEDRLRSQNEQLSGILWSKGIGNALRLWDGWSHDWPYWAKMMQLYLSGHD